MLKTALSTHNPYFGHEIKEIVFKYTPSSKDYIQTYDDEFMELCRQVLSFQRTDVKNLDYCLEYNDSDSLCFSYYNPFH